LAQEGLASLSCNEHQIIPEINVLTPLFLFFERINPIILKLEIYPANPLLILASTNWLRDAVGSCGEDLL
jgi:hypothetical protein